MCYIGVKIGLKPGSTGRLRPAVLSAQPAEDARVSMCGILGEWNLVGTPVALDRFEHARDRMWARGPDQCGLWVGDRQSLALGHRRLAILDVSEAGRQPMSDPATGNVLVFNGEIYNFQELARELRAHGFQFQSRSDSEVILAAYRHWGDQCVRRFVGMFAFALWEPARRRLFLARDPLGVKPLFYTTDPSRLTFSSRLEPLVLLSGSSELDQAGLSEFLQMGRTSGRTTLLRGVEKLLPGHTLVVDDEGMRTEAYWQPDDFPEDSLLFGQGAGELVDRLDHLLQDSVRLRLVSDVPVGVFLSGGVDSTLVTALMKEVGGGQVSTFTVGFREFGFDESTHARRVAGHLQTDHHELLLDPDDLLNEIVHVLDTFDEPVADTAAVPLSLVTRLAREHVTVCLSGDGGDELFHGYPMHHVLQQINWLRRMPAWGVRGLGALAGLSSRSRCQLLAKLCRQGDVLDRYLYLRSQSRDVAISKSGGWGARSGLEAFLPDSVDLSSASLAARWDLRNYLPDELLVKTDLATMLHSLEAREPLLDHRLAAFALSVPGPLKQNKRLLKQVLARYVPREIWDRPKQGFNVPVDEWLRGPLKFLLDETVANWEFDTPLDRDGLAALARQQACGTANLSSFLWTCIAVERWHKRLRQWSAEHARLQVPAAA